MISAEKTWTDLIKLTSVWKKYRFFLFWHQLWSLFSLKMLAKIWRASSERASESVWKFWIPRASGEKATRIIGERERVRALARSPSARSRLISQHFQNTEEGSRVKVQTHSKDKRWSSSRIFRQISELWTQRKRSFSLCEIRMMRLLPSTKEEEAMDTLQLWKRVFSRRKCGFRLV